MTDTTDQQAVTVAQEDREAACETYLRFRYGQPPLYTNIAAGRIDHDPIVQHFARHRLASVSSASAEPRALDWRLIAKAAGEHGVRYRTNTAMAKFLAAIASPEPVPATNQAGEVERLRTALRFYADLSEPRAWSQPVIIDAQHPNGRRNDGPAIPSQALLEDRGEWARHALATQPATSREGEEPTCERCDRGVCVNPHYEDDDRLNRPAATPTPPTLSEDLRVLVEMLEAATLEEGVRVYEHDAEEIGLATMNCRADLLAALARAQVSA